TGDAGVSRRWNNCLCCGPARPMKCLIFPMFSTTLCSVRDGATGFTSARQRSLMPAIAAFPSLDAYNRAAVRSFGHGAGLNGLQSSHLDSHRISIFVWSFFAMLRTCCCLALLIAFLV